MKTNLFLFKQVLVQSKIERKKDAPADKQQPILSDEKSPRFLFVDNLTPIEIVISFSSLSKWYEQRIEVIPEKITKAKNNPDLTSVSECMCFVI
jgi:hypothetical protein